MTCSVCGKEITPTPWNERVDILICKDKACRAYGRPQGTVKKIVEDKS